MTARAVSVVVVWCRNGIRYNTIATIRTSATVVVWCRNGIRYNIFTLPVALESLWFDVEME